MPEMNALLKRDADALWKEVTDPKAKKLGWMERKALEKHKNMIYSLFEKYFGHAYARLDHLNAPKGGAE